MYLLVRANLDSATERGVELFGEFPALKGKTQVIEMAQFFRLWLFSRCKLRIKNHFIKEAMLLVAGLPPSARFSVFVILGEKMWSLSSFVTHPVKRKKHRCELRSQFSLSILLSYESVETS